MRRFDSLRGGLLASIALAAATGVSVPSHASLVVVPDPVRAPRAEAVPVAVRGGEPRAMTQRDARASAATSGEKRQAEQRCLDELMLYSLGDPHGTGASNRRMRCD